MTARTAARTAVAVGVVVTVAALLAAAYTLPDLGAWAELAALPNVLAYAWCGVAVTTRVPGNPIGRLLLRTSVGLLLLEWSLPVARTLVVTSPGIARWVAWTNTWSWLIVLDALVIVLPAVLPSGTLLRGWRWWLVFGRVFVVIALVGNVVTTAPIDLGGHVVRNPVAWGALDRIVHGPVLDVTGTVLFGGVVVGAVTALVVRYRSTPRAARGAFRLVLLALLLVPLTFLAHDVSEGLANAVALVILPLLPAAIVLSVARYQLWDVRRLVSRTVSWGLASAVLVGVYAGAVLALSDLLSGTFGSVGVAVVTLAVAAAFVPVRHLVQRWVDRRFDRAAFDAERAVRAFGARIRSEVDTDRLAAELVSTVHRTVAPSRVDVWLVTR